MSHRSWFPSILIGLSLALAALIAVAYRHPSVDESPRVPEDETPAVAAPTTQEYEAGVRAALAGYEAARDASAAYDVLVAMRVPSVDYQAAHLELVIALAQIKSGNIDEGQARLDLAKTAYPWLAE